MHKKIILKYSSPEGERLFHIAAQADFVARSLFVTIGKNLSAQRYTEEIDLLNTAATNFKKLIDEIYETLRDTYSKKNSHYHVQRLGFNPHKIAKNLYEPFPSKTAIVRSEIGNLYFNLTRSTDLALLLCEAFQNALNLTIWEALKFRLQNEIDTLEGAVKTSHKLWVSLQTKSQQKRGK